MFLLQTCALALSRTDFVQLRPENVEIFFSSSRLVPETASDTKCLVTLNGAGGGDYRKLPEAGFATAPQGIRYPCHLYGSISSCIVCD